MATRDDILAELRLAPQWVRRDVPAADVPARAAATAAPAPPGTQDPRSLAIATLDFAGLATHIAECRACKLCETRQRTVPGVGDEHADWLFVGEAPGAEEDARGEPFVGQAGRLLDNMLAALGLARQRNVYIANVLKCRPPNNRAPEPLEAAQCMPYLARQIALLQPRLIVALGRSAAVQLLNVDAPIASLRGRVHRHAGIPLIVTYHPAYLLRNLPDKAKAWEDLVLARRTARDGTAPEQGMR
ncbi:MAG: uracil-DNA glycosylase [Proteobacteria bacterium]|nr:uracil-DNA glycosylase [Pseudomonadota bacterium]